MANIGPTYVTRIKYPHRKFLPIAEKDGLMKLMNLIVEAVVLSYAYLSPILVLLSVYGETRRMKQTRLQRLSGDAN